MKETILFASILTGITLQADAVIIAGWDFETNTPPDVTDAAANGPHNPSTGSGSASGSHVSATTDWSTPTGNGSTNSYSSNTWAVGDYYQFTLSTLIAPPESGLFVSFSQISSGTGPRDFKLEYSSSGAAGAYSSVGIVALTANASGGTYSVLANAAPNSWTAANPVPASFYSFDLSGVPALLANSTVAFRLTDTSTTSTAGGTVAAGGTDRIDDFIVSTSPTATPTPEPTTAVTLLSGLAMLGLLRRRPSRS